jgi:hypothetical protein
MNQPEPAADDPASVKKTLDTRRLGIGNNIIILGNPANQQVPDCTPYYIGIVTVAAQTLYDPHGIGIDRSWIYAMLCIGIHKRFFYGFAVRPFLITYEHNFPWEQP